MDGNLVTEEKNNAVNDDGAVVNGGWCEDVGMRF